MPSNDRHVAIVGAGVGGLATAARLAQRGYQVDVYEKLPECGGRAHVIEDAGFKFDTGPSFVLMPDFFEEVFSYCGEQIQDYLDLRILEKSYQIFYPNGRRLIVHRDSEKTKQEFESLEPGAARGFDSFIAETTRIYNAIKPLLYRCFTKGDIFDWRNWPLIFKLNPFQTYWQLARKYFKSEELCYAMTFEAMFIGVSPFETPGFYSVITYTDHVQKIAHPMGGMIEIPRALERLGRKFGARYHYSQEIRSVRPNGQAAVLKTQRSEFPAGQVVFNADYASTQTDLLDRQIPRYDYSCSVYLLYLGLKRRVEGLEHHNLFFANDLKKNLRQIFKDKTTVDDPSFYIHVPTVTDPSLAPPGKEILYILIPVANLERQDFDFADYEHRLRDFVFDKINTTFGIKLEDLIEVEHHFYPVDFIKRYNIKYGATFGLAHTLLQSAFLRPANRDSRYRNYYYVGASTQPGGGLPPVIASSRIVADMIIGE